MSSTLIVLIINESILIVHYFAFENECSVTFLQFIALRTFLLLQYQGMKKVNFSLKLNKGRDIYLHLSMITLAIIGVLMTISASMSTNVISYDLAIQGLKQFGFVLIGYVAYLTFSKFIRIHSLNKLVLPIMLL